MTADVVPGESECVWCGCCKGLAALSCSVLACCFRNLLFAGGCLYCHKTVSSSGCASKQPSTVESGDAPEQFARCTQPVFVLRRIFNSQGIKGNRNPHQYIAPINSPRKHIHPSKIHNIHPSALLRSNCTAKRPQESSPEKNMIVEMWRPKQSKRTKR